MESVAANSPADLSTQQLSMPHFHQRICKLRWIGDDDEAETLLRTKGDSAFTWPVETATD